MALPLRTKGHSLILTRGELGVFLECFIEGNFVIITNFIGHIYDIQVFPDHRRPGLLAPDTEVHETSIAAPDLNFWRRPTEKDEDEDPEDPPTFSPN